MLLPVPVANRLIAALPPADRDRLAANLTPVRPGFKERLHHQGGFIDDVYFPCDGVISLVRTMNDGTTAEVATVGNDGMLGASVLSGDPTSYTDAIVQVRGELAYKMPVSAFLREMELGGALLNHVMRYHHALTLQIQQTAACNALHGAGQRCCRWLLATCDRVNSTDIRITQDAIASALGVRRPTVTLVIGSLERAGLVVSESRGTVTICDRERLASLACECYATIKAHIEQVYTGVLSASAEPSRAAS